MRTIDVLLATIALCAPAVDAACPATAPSLGVQATMPNREPLFRVDELVGAPFQFDIDGDTAVVFATPYRSDSLITTLRRTGNGWTTISSQDLGPFDLFRGPRLVALSGDRLALAAPDGYQDRVDVFRREGDRWRLVRILGSESQQGFGNAIAWYDDELLIADRNGGPGPWRLQRHRLRGDVLQRLPDLVGPADAGAIATRVQVAGELLAVGERGAMPGSGSPAIDLFVRDGSAWRLERRHATADLDESDFALVSADLFAFERPGAPFENRRLVRLHRAAEGWTGPETLARFALARFAAIADAGDGFVILRAARADAWPAYVAEYVVFRYGPGFASGELRLAADPFAGARLQAGAIEGGSFFALTLPARDGLELAFAGTTLAEATHVDLAFVEPSVRSGQRVRGDVAVTTAFGCATGYAVLELGNGRCETDVVDGRGSCFLRASGRNYAVGRASFAGDRPYAPGISEGTILRIR